MEELVEQAAVALRGMPPTMRDRMATVILAVARGEKSVLEVDLADLEDVLTGMAEIDRGDFASEDEVAAAFRLFEK